LTRGLPRLARAILPALLTLALLVACRSGSPAPTPTSAPATPSAAPGSPTIAGSPAASGSPTLARPGTPAATPIVVTQTQVVVIKPVDASGLAAPYNRGASVVGSCLGPSLVTTSRADAWRCAVNGTGDILDPCFSHGTDRQPALFCFRQPWITNVTLMVPSAPLPDGRPDSGDPTTPHPWGIELADGVRCSIETESMPLIEGQRVSATCTDGRNTIGDVDRSQHAWSILVVQNRTSQPQRIQIIRAWY
jgi:hypothetical protein